MQKLKKQLWAPLPIVYRLYQPCLCWVHFSYDRIQLFRVFGMILRTHLFALSSRAFISNISSIPHFVRSFGRCFPLWDWFGFPEHLENDSTWIYHLPHMPWLFLIVYKNLWVYRKCVHVLSINCSWFCFIAFLAVSWFLLGLEVLNRHLSLESWTNESNFCLSLASLL